MASTKRRILLQLDPDMQASVFDAVVAIDSEIDHLLQYGRVEVDKVRDLVYGAMFTRGPQDLHNTAIFVGGSDVAAGEALLKKVTQCFFGPMRVSVMLDANGANTTAAAAVLAAERHVVLSKAKATVLAATGPVGQRIVRLLAGEGAEVVVASRSMERAQGVCKAVTERVPTAKLHPAASSSADDTAAAIADSSIVFAAGAAGVELLSEDARRKAKNLNVAIDLNAVPPLGIGGINATDKGTEYDGVFCFGALGVGATKMKIHKAAIKKLFSANDLVLDAEEILAIGRQLLNREMV